MGKRHDCGELKCMIIDDVISAGTSVRESVKIIKGESACPVAVVITLDRRKV